MSIKALEGLVPTWYTPAGQDEDDKPTKFKCQPLDGQQYAEVSDHVKVAGSRIVISAEGQSLCLKYGLIDWENFNDSAGPVAFIPSNHRLIPFATRVDLTVHIFASSSMSGEQEKN